MKRSSCAQSSLSESDSPAGRGSRLVQENALFEEKTPFNFQATRCVGGLVLVQYLLGFELLLE